MPDRPYRRLLLCLILSAGGAALTACAQSAPRGRTEQRGDVIVQILPAAPYPRATSVRLLVKDLGDDSNGPLFSNPKGRILSPAQRAQLEAAFSDVRAIARAKAPDPKYALAACFDPHHFFRYYDNRGRQVGEVAVCFCCGGVRATPDPFPGGGQRYLDVDYLAAEKLIKAMGVPVNVGCDP